MPAPARSCGGAWQAAGDIYLDKYAGWYSVRDEAYYDESELKEGADGAQALAARHAGRMGRGGELFLQLSAYQDRLLAYYEAHPDFIGPDTRRERGEELRARRPAGSFDLAHDLRLGHSGARRSEAHHVCVGRCADELSHRRRFPRRGVGDIQALLAGRRAYHRQGHHPLSRGLLAGLPDVGRHRRCRSGCSAMAFSINRGEKMSKSVGNVVDPFVLAEGLRRRPAPLFPAARGAVRPGRQLQPRRHRATHQCRPRQRSRQSRAALAVDDRQELRRASAGAGRL